MSSYHELTEKIDADKRWLEAIVPIMRRLKIKEFQTVVLEPATTCTACGETSDVFYDGVGGRTLCPDCAADEGCETDEDRL